MSATIWETDLGHSGIHFSVRHLVVAKVRGRFTRFTSTLNLDLADLTRSSVTAEIDASSIDTGVEQRDTHLRSGDFLEVEKFPKLTFVSTRIAGTAEELKITGDLTLRGVTREVTLVGEYLGQTKDPWGGQRVGFSASTSISRKEFGLTWNQVLEAGGLAVGDKIEITLDLEAVAAAAAKAA